MAMPAVLPSDSVAVVPPVRLGASRLMLGILSSNACLPDVTPWKVSVPLVMLASETLVCVTFQPVIIRGKLVPAAGRLFEKFGVLPFSVMGVAPPKLGVPGALMQTLVLQAGGVGAELLLDELLLEALLLEELLPEELLPELDELLLGLDALLLEAVVLGAAPLPPPLEQAARARRQTDDARPMALLDRLPMTLPEIVLLLFGWHGNSQPMSR